MMRIYKYFGVFLLFAVIFSYVSSAAASDTMQSVASFEGGKRYQSGKIHVLDLHGNYRQMGRQYGHLLKSEINILYKSAILDYFQKQQKLSADTMQKTANALYQSYPQRFKDILSGMAETSGLSLDEQVMLNALELFGSLSGCSAIIAWGSYTGSQSLIAGRNYDWFEKYHEFARSLTVTIFHPDSGVPNAIITFAGVMYATTGINAGGIFLELNNGLPSGGGLSYANRIPAMVSLLSALNDYRSLKEVDAFFNTTRTDFAFIINTADSSQGVSYEWAPFEHRRHSGNGEGLLVSTNHFTDPSWGIVMQDNVGFQTLLRRKNLLDLAQKNKGKINIEIMKDLLDTSIGQGGATWPLQGHIQTVYQIIAMPEKMHLWLKIPGFQDWTPVELGRFFAKASK
ncbi:MAG TPA: C45 family autoproteolytic acyltransferase/hydrolase [Smithellaceae bacterium]|nr:C45 family autoproteolytic acyltransferase/hydrolase [Smithellaceae bacterium]HQM46155.1 C45 family autoproteolytic acyltransferase/hydrolase [Smithellaceae bacterium]